MPARVRLSLLSRDALAALSAGDLDAASAAAGIALPTDLLAQTWLWDLRLRQVTDEPASGPWLVRAVVALDVPEQPVVGHAGFHGPPDETGTVEVGYSVVPSQRGRGYARAALAELLNEAAGAPAVRTVRASVSPDNAASLALVHQAGFVQVGEQVDEIDGLELVLERPARPGADPDGLRLHGVDHVVFVCADVERVLAWWTGALGLAPERVDAWRAGRVPFPSVRLSPTALVDLVPGQRGGENVAHVALDVDLPMDDIVALARDRGLDVVDGPRSLFGARGTGDGLYVRDPEGNVVELRTYR